MGAGVAAVGFRVGGCAAALAPRPLPENCRDNFFPINGIRAIVNGAGIRQRIAGPLVAAEATQKLKKTRFRLD